MGARKDVRQYPVRAGIVVDEENFHHGEPELSRP